MSTEITQIVGALLKRFTGKKCHFISKVTPELPSLENYFRSY